MVYAKIEEEGGFTKATTSPLTAMLINQYNTTGKQISAINEKKKSRMTFLERLAAEEELEKLCAEQMVLYAKIEESELSTKATKASARKKEAEKK